MLDKVSLRFTAKAIQGVASLQQWVQGIRIRYLAPVDVICIWLALLLAFVVRFETTPQLFLLVQANWILFLITPLARLPVYFYFRLYHRLWRYAGSPELVLIIVAGCTAPALLYIVNFWLLPIMGMPHQPSRSIWLLEAVFSFCLLAGTRFLLRLLHEESYLRRIFKPHIQDDGNTSKTHRLLLVGAGDSGSMILRDLQTKQMPNLQIVGLIDDNPQKLGMQMHGATVLGGRDLIPEVVARRNVNQMIIAMPTAPGREIRNIVQICNKAGITPRIVPSLHELINGQVTLDKVRNVQIEDLLRREAVVTDTAAVNALLHGRRVLVTGAGGSIGSELCRQILRCQPATLIMVGHGENSIFEAHHELKYVLDQQLADKNAEDEVLATELFPVIADIRFADRIHAIFRQYEPEIVFHAAAHKHVPLMEENPAEAVTNNVSGTRNIIKAALEVGVERFVLISTDKAVNPTSVMGACKRVAEMLVHQAARRSNRAYVAVRFGNVLGSRGSVVHTFRRQIERGGPVTITHPEITRYFMTIPEAVQLVLQSSVLGKGGEVFLLDMGEPVRIVDLARDLIRLSGHQEEGDIEIQFTGLRPGEKLFEELFAPGEGYQHTQHDKIYLAKNASSFIPNHLGESLALLEQFIRENNNEAVLNELKHLVSEYQPNRQSLAPQPLNEKKETKVKQTPVRSSMTFNSEPAAYTPLALVPAATSTLSQSAIE
jgi:FlaA1/EpsC-like NDP-sugar epimerase